MPNSNRTCVITASTLLNVLLQKYNKYQKEYDAIAKLTDPKFKEVQQRIIWGKSRAIQEVMDSLKYICNSCPNKCSNVIGIFESQSGGNLP